ncbi:MAG: sarcinarray family MAST domain-containing protein [Euryarchaeota archaeon]|nr:sarcinarray family MAST domain-containing protein [Euryarchaeota archaeon]
MKIRILILTFAVLFSISQIALAEENDYGTVNAWFNGKNATIETVEGIKLRIGEPSDVKIEVTSKISGHVIVALTETGGTKAYDVSSGPSKQDERIDNLNIESGWSKTYTWTVIPNGAWKNGNAPINIFIKFYDTKTKKEKIIQFTIVNPYILDEQYPGSSPAQTTGAAQPSPTGTSSEPQQAPFLEAAGAIAVMLGVWMWKRGSRT